MKIFLHTLFSGSTIVNSLEVFFQMLLGEHLYTYVHADTPTYIHTYIHIHKLKNMNEILL